MAKDNVKKQDAKSLRYIIVAVCILLIAIVGAVLGVFMNNKNAQNNAANFVDSLNAISRLGIENIENAGYTLSQSKTDKNNSEKNYALLQIGSVSPKRFIAKNYPNMTFYALYDAGFGYQYNSSSNTNEKNNFSSELNVLDMQIEQAYWLDYDSHKIYLYFAKLSGEYTVIVSDFAF